jgi:glycosyltransferase involved in cell wall biosynthesis
MPLTNLAIDASRMVRENRTGTENYAVGLVHAMARMPNLPDITLYARRGFPIQHPSGMTVRESGPARLWTHIGLSRAMRRDRPDALFVPAHVIPLIHPKASVVTVHDLGYIHEPKAHPRRQRLFLDRTTRWNARSAQRIIAISGQTRDDLVEHYRVPRNKITVVHMGVDHGRFNPRPGREIACVKRECGIKGPYLLFVSTVQPRKNVKRLVEAFETLDEPHLELVIAGKPGWLSEPIEKRIQESRLARRIHRLGRVSDADLPALYSGAAAYVFPSLFEGFGMGVVEAMASGAPVVTSRVPSLTEVSGDAAILVDPESVDSIAEGIQAALDPEMAVDLRQRGLKRARDFSWDTAARQTLQVIQDAYDEA